MLKEEWLSIGYEKGLIDDITESEKVPFSDVYRAWFKSKINQIKPQSVDRIEVTYNRYYRDSQLVRMAVNEIDEKAVFTFLNAVIIGSGNITYKEYQRIFQIVNNVMTYAYDLNIGHCYCINWNTVKRYVAFGNIKSNNRKEMCVSSEDRKRLASAVLDDCVYSEKRSATLLLLANFMLGLRIGELASLRWQDVNLTERYIFVHSTQTKFYARDDSGERVGCMKYHNQDTTKTPHSVRVVPLVNETVYILQILKKWHEMNGYQSDYLAYDGTDTILTRSLERTLHRLCGLVGVSDFNSHRIRKTYSSELHRNGVPTRMISDVMGHADMRTTENNYILGYDDTLSVIRNAMKEGVFLSLKGGVNNAFQKPIRASDERAE